MLKILNISVFLVLASCSKTKILLEFPPDSPTAVADKLTRDFSEVGAAEVDITPPPGVASAGYSSLGYNFEGVYSRLKARAFYLAKPNGPPVMLVSLDLLSGSLLLHHMTSSAIHEATGVEPSALVLSGTHTHGGPGNFFASQFYNDWGGTKSGVDKNLVNFLSEKIKSVAIEAYRSRKQGTITIGATPLKGLTRNRSLEAFLANPDRTTSDPLEAVNPFLYGIRLDAMVDGELSPIGALFSFSIHGTTLPPTKLINADLFGFAASAVKDEFKNQNGSDHKTVAPIIGFVNGSHGDNSPNYDHQGIDSAETIGINLGSEAFQLLKSLKPNSLDQDPKGVIRVASEEIDLHQEIAQNPEKTLLCAPKVGMSLVAGAEDGANPFLKNIYGFREGTPGEQSYYECQGQKRVLGSFMQNLIVPNHDFPKYALVQVIKINDFTMLTFPFEVTYMMGQRLKQPIKDKLDKIGDHDPNIAVISCTNGFTGYLTTPEEYTKQHYEGGHNLFGPKTGIFFTNVISNLNQKTFDHMLYGSMQKISNFSLGSSKSSENSIVYTNQIPTISKQPEITQIDGQRFVVMHLSYKTLDDSSRLLAPMVHVNVQPINNALDVIKSSHFSTSLNNEHLEIEYLDTSDRMAKFEYRLRLSDKLNLDQPFSFQVLNQNLEILTETNTISFTKFTH